MISARRPDISSEPIRTVLCPLFDDATQMSLARPLAGCTRLSVRALRESLHRVRHDVLPFHELILLFDSPGDRDETVVVEATQITGAQSAVSSERSVALCVKTVVA